MESSLEALVRVSGVGVAAAGFVRGQKMLAFEGVSEVDIVASEDACVCVCVRTQLVIGMCVHVASLHACACVCGPSRAHAP